MLVDHSLTCFVITVFFAITRPYGTGKGWRRGRGDSPPPFRSVRRPTGLTGSLARGTWRAAGLLAHGAVTAAALTAPFGECVAVELILPLFAGIRRNHCRIDPSGAAAIDYTRCRGARSGPDLAGPDSAGPDRLRFAVAGLGHRGSDYCHDPGCVRSPCFIPLTYGPGRLARNPQRRSGKKCGTMGAAPPYLALPTIRASPPAQATLSPLAVFVRRIVL